MPHDIERQLAELKSLLAALQVEATRLTGVERVATDQRIAEVQRQIATLELAADEAQASSARQYPTAPSQSAFPPMPDSPFPYPNGIPEQINGLRRDVTRLQSQVDILVTDGATMKADLRYIVQEINERKQTPNSPNVDSRLMITVLIISTMAIFFAITFFNLVR